MGCVASSSSAHGTQPSSDESQLLFVIHEKGCCDSGSVRAPKDLGPCSENEFALIRALLRPGDNEEALQEIPKQFNHLSAAETDRRFVPTGPGGAGYFETVLVVTKVGYVDAPTEKVEFTVPAGAGPGQAVIIQHGNYKISTVVPADLVEGNTFKVDVPVSPACVSPPPGTTRSLPGSPGPAGSAGLSPGVSPAASVRSCAF